MPLLHISWVKLVSFLCACCSLRVVVDDGRMKGVEWTGNSRWMPVTIGLVGAAMDMRAIGPTLRLTSPFLVCINSPSLSRSLFVHLQLLHSIGCSAGPLLARLQLLLRVLEDALGVLVAQTLGFRALFLVAGHENVASVVSPPTCMW